MPLKTLFLNPPSFENFDGGAGSRWPATREIESYWYPVWLAYPAGMLEGARLLDAPAHHVSAEETIKIALDYEFLVLYTSTPGFPGDIQLAAKIKEANPKIKISFVGPHVTVLPDRTLKDGAAIDFICRKEFDYSVYEFAHSKPLEEILGVSYRKDGVVVHNPDRPHIQDLDALPHVTDVYYKIWIRDVTTCRSFFIPTFRCTPREAARRSALSACGRKPPAAMPGASARPTTWLAKWPRPRNTGRG